MFVIGLVVGSFLNVVIYRLPLMLEREWRAQAADLSPSPDAPHAPHAPHAPQATHGAHGAAHAATIHAGAAQAFNLLTPRSACPACKAPIKARHNVPVLSWLWLRGRCAACRARIPARYPAVELACALSSAAVAWHFGFGAAAACALLVTWALIALGAIDIDHQLLPDGITLPLMWTGLLAAVAFGPLPGSALPVAPRDAIFGAAAAYLSLWLVFQIFRLVTGKEGMGYGDFKLFAALGAWLGWTLLPLIIVLAAAAGAALGLLMIALRGRERSAPIPFGPYLAMAGWLAMLYGHRMIGAYLRISGLAG
ncbi:MAG TPA: A24 family peptidase [Steroidobacteraceae bacterium]|nr:A24 family peptidase [Steroidobacteraceae bacterium]